MQTAKSRQFRILVRSSFLFRPTAKEAFVVSGGQPHNSGSCNLAFVADVTENALYLDSVERDRYTDAAITRAREFLVELRKPV